MSFEIIYHELVVSEDIPRLDGRIKRQIKQAIASRLMTAPELYGKPLRRSLNGYLKLRVGDYRVIFRIQGPKVKIFIIGHRSWVYDKIWLRL